MIFLMENGFCNECKAMPIEVGDCKRRISPLLENIESCQYSDICSSKNRWQTSPQWSFVVVDVVQ